MNESRIAEFALAAHEYVRRAVALDLDGSVESLAYVDHNLAEVAREPVSAQVLALVAPAIGAYFGEVLAAHLGGEWHAAGDDPATWHMAIPGPDGRPLLEVVPVALAAEALAHGEVAGYDATLQPPPELAARLADALARVSPVEEGYYYSLTGRLETIEHVVELLAEMRRPAEET
jgi:hypothetical protein